MKKILSILCVLMLTTSVFAQAPEKISYQAVVRGADGNLITNQAVTLQISIIRESAGGTTVFTENHQTSTNDYGLANIIVGEGTPVYGFFQGINWGSFQHFIKISLDPTGGSNFTVMGTSQILSVPYSLHAKTSADNKWQEASGKLTSKNNDWNVGIGTQNPAAKLEVKGSSPTAPLFDVKDEAGNTVFAVYPEGARVYVKEGVSGGNSGFRVFGRDTTSAVTEWMKVTADSVRFFISDADDNKSSNRGGFAVTGRAANKDTSYEYLRVTNDSTRIYTVDTISGFGVQNIGTTNSQSYMRMTPKNYFIGHESGQNITTGIHNSFFGYQAGKNNTSAPSNVFIGYQAGMNTSGGTLWHQGGLNVFIGYKCGFSNTTGGQNTALGYQTLYKNTTGRYNVALGRDAMYENIDGEDNVAVGRNASYYNTSGEYNVAVGTNAVYLNTTGTANVGVGVNSLYSNQTGSYNSAFGSNALGDNTIGNNNTAVGNTALINNKEGSFNTAIGYDADFSSSNSYNNTTMVGSGAKVFASNTIRVGNNSVTSIGGIVDWTALSDGRFKSNIEEDVPGLAFINKLRPVTYNLDIQSYNKSLGIKDSASWEGKYDSEKIRRTGFIAQEVEQAAIDINYDFSGVDKTSNDKYEMYGLRYAEFTVPIVKAIQEQQAVIETLLNEINSLKEINNELILRIERLEER